MAPLLVGIIINEMYMERMALDYKINTIETKETEENIKFTIITFKNSGNKSIPVSAYDKNIQIMVENSKVLECIVSEESSKHLDVKISYDSSNVFIQPLLLNPKEHFSLYMLTQGEKPEIQIIPRIDGISQPLNKLDLDFNNKYILRYLAIHLSVFSGILLLLIYTKLRAASKSRSVIKKFSTLIFIIPVILVRYCSVFFLTQSFGFSILKFTGIYVCVIVISHALLTSFNALEISSLNRTKKRKN